MMPGQRPLRVLLVVCALALAAACSPPVFKAVDITGANYARDFSLMSTAGPRTLADYRGKVVVIFFGYTQCPDVCPTTNIAPSASADAR
jgi:protein SCO1